jgi:hypothetical protein
MKTAPAQKYRDSEKRKITKEQNRAAIQKPRQRNLWVTDTVEWCREGRLA